MSLDRLLLLVALAGPPVAQGEVHPPGRPPAAGQAGGAAPPGNTGVLDEAEFARLHTLKTDEAPAAKGTLVDLADGSKAYLTLPEKWQPGGVAVLVIHEWWGLNSHIKHWADRFTATGRAALAVDLYGGKVATKREEASAAMQAVDQAKATATLLAGHAFLKADPRVKAGKRASIGWCFGGAMSLQLALNAPDLDAAVMYYGRPVTDAAELKKIKAPLFGVFGERDRAFPPALIEQFRNGLAAAGVEHDVQLFPADHAFANPSGGNYDAKVAADAWEKVQAFLDRKVPVKR
jgi:carboxymethylenebutenolidase